MGILSFTALIRVVASLSIFAVGSGRALAQPVVRAVVNAASYVGGTLSPGEMTVLFGTGLGPTKLVSLQLDAGGRIASSLAGVTVTFNGVPSPLVYVSANQIAAMTPYELAGFATAKVRVSYANVTSQPVTVKIVTTQPGIFSADGSGIGNAAALNQDDSRNSAENPAQPGSSVVFYLTGAGQTTPAGSDGHIATGISNIYAPITATIGGVPTHISYAGSAPGNVNGFTQINAVVPSDLQYGGNLPLFVQVGDVTSQPGLTIAITGSTAPFSISSAFSANSTTISTSEGAPYGDCDFWVEGPCINESNFGYGPTKVVRMYICLSGMVSIGSCSQQPAVTGSISSDMLTRIEAGIAAYARSGVRVMPRFTYNFGPIGSEAMDAPLKVILNHLDQLAPILLKYKDLIFALEAGFIGTWGEWHDSTNGNDTVDAHKTILDKELSYFSGAFPILVRDPGVLITYTGTLVPQPHLGIHDDYYASSADDATTWLPCNPSLGYCLANSTQSQIRSYGAAVATTVMFAGEFGGLYPPLQTCSALDEYSILFHPQSITLLPYPPEVGIELQSEGCTASFYNQVGTRIVLNRAAMSGNAIPGGRLSVALTMINAGYGRVIRQRPVTFVLMQKGRTVAQIPIPLQNMDLRTLQSFTEETFQSDLLLPTTLQSGPVSVALLIPDPAPSLSSDPAYALPLNSLDQNGSPIFDPTTGYNFIDGGGPSLGSAFQLTSAGGLTSNPNEVIDGIYSIKGSYTGTGTYTTYLETVPSVLPLISNHTYQITCRYRIVATPSNGFSVIFFSQTAASSNNFLSGFTISGTAGDSGTVSLTNTLGPYSDYQVLWDINGTGGVTIDDIQIIDVASGKVIAKANAEPTEASPLSILP